MATGKVMYLLGFSVAVALAAIVYIIVDKTCMVLYYGWNI